VSLRLYDTATREVRDFTPLEPGRAGIYLCGATVQSSPHIGHLRSGVAFDILWRWLEAGHGYDVTFVRNVTDIDDKILSKSAEAGVPWWAWAYRFEQEFAAAYDAVGVRRPTYEPRATGHATEMVALMQSLIERGHAYAAEDGSGDVYFDVRSWGSYGELTHQSIDDMAPAEDADPRGKRDPRDFALWKGHKQGEPESASWPAPSGMGRPGWHLECSAMIRRYLGESFDIHGGGIDLRFPHHENEQAQSHAAGFGFASYWLHNGWVTTGGEKMSKSLGNSLIVATILERTRPIALRYYLGAAHYRSNIEYHEGSLREAESAVERIETFMRRAADPSGWFMSFGGGQPEAFAAAMDDDLNVSGALAVLHDTVRAGNTALDEGDDDAVRAAYQDVVRMTDALGINPLAEPWSAGGARDNRAEDALDELLTVELEERQAARARRDFVAADGIRDRLLAAGIEIEDTAAGARWALARRPQTEDEES
jgi:cysteinyl-tRNA synthetase